jgi:hypothetical protein
MKIGKHEVTVEFGRFYRLDIEHVSRVWRMWCYTHPVPTYLHVSFILGWVRVAYCYWDRSIP